MMEFWTTRTLRERALILLAAGLAVALLLNVLVIGPLRSARAEATTSLAVAARTLDAVSAVRPSGHAGDVRAAEALAGEDIRARLVDLAARRGLAVSRLQSNEKGAIIIQFDQAAAPALFGWLETAERELGATPSQASVFAEASGTVRGSFEFRGGAS